MQRRLQRYDNMEICRIHVAHIFYCPYNRHTTMLVSYRLNCSLPGCCNQATWMSWYIHLQLMYVLCIWTLHCVAFSIIAVCKIAEDAGRGSEGTACHVLLSCVVVCYSSIQLLVAFSTTLKFGMGLLFEVSIYVR